MTHPVKDTSSVPVRDDPSRPVASWSSCCPPPAPPEVAMPPRPFRRLVRAAASFRAHSWSRPPAPPARCSIAGRPTCTTRRNTVRRRAVFVEPRRLDHRLGAGMAELGSSAFRGPRRSSWRAQPSATVTRTRRVPTSALPNGFSAWSRGYAVPPPRPRPSPRLGVSPPAPRRTPRRRVRPAGRRGAGRK